MRNDALKVARSIQAKENDIQQITGNRFNKSSVPFSVWMCIFCGKKYFLDTNTPQIEGQNLVV